MKVLQRLIKVVGCGVFISLGAPALAQDAPPATEAQPSESIAIYGAMVLHGILSTSDLLDYATSNCDYLSAADMVAVQQWLQRTGIYCE